MYSDSVCWDVVVLGEPVTVTGVIFAYPFPECPVSVPPDVLVKEVFPAYVEALDK